MSAYDAKNLARMERTLLERSSAAWEAARPRKASNNNNNTSSRNIMLLQSNYSSISCRIYNIIISM